MTSLSTEKQVADLADADLCAIFERLPLLDWLIASEVCRRWHGLSRKSWLDITELNLSSIPKKHIGAIVRQCPNVRSISARKKSFDVNELATLAKSSSLSTVKLYDCSFAVSSDLRVVNDAFSKLFSENLQRASWNELVLHDVRLDEKLGRFSSVPLLRAVFAIARVFLTTLTRPQWVFSAVHLPASLTRLQLSGLCYLRTADRWEHCAELFLDGLQRLRNLESLILLEPPLPTSICMVYNDFISHGLLYDAICPRVCALKYLRELCVGPACSLTRQYYFSHLISSLPKLEVLFLIDVCGEMMAQDLRELVTANSVLRILLLSGVFGRTTSEPIDIPARKRFPNGFDSDPLPLLHIFIGKRAAEELRFAQCSSDAAIIHPINEPIRVFFEREDIAPIFKGVWVAERVKDVAKSGRVLWPQGRC